MELTPDEVGRKIKELHPEYGRVPDSKLGMAYVKKYGFVNDPSRKDASSTPTSAVPGPMGGGGQVSDLIKKYFPKDQWQNALAVAKGESGLNPGAIGDNYSIRGQTIPSYGVFQIRGLPGRPPKEQLLDPEQNIKYAANLFASQGWRPWTVARKLGLTK
mgnify:CR=1 FL=1